jgi:hypothetical protein
MSMKTKGRVGELANDAGVYLKNKYLALKSGNIVEKKRG